MPVKITDNKSDNKRFPLISVKNLHWRSSVHTKATLSRPVNIHASVALKRNGDGLNENKYSPKNTNSGINSTINANTKGSCAKAIPETTSLTLTCALTILSRNLYSTQSKTNKAGIPSTVRSVYLELIPSILKTCIFIRSASKYILRV